MPVDLPTDQKKGKKLYRGYFNYRILSDKTNALKSLYFYGYTKEVVKRLTKQFSNVAMYHYYGRNCVRAFELEKDVPK